MLGGVEGMLISSWWASMAAWFTPTFLFCLLNLMIATIFIASNFKSPHHDSPGQLAPAPSLLERIKSGFYTHQHPYTSYDSPAQFGHGPVDSDQQRLGYPSQLDRTPSVLERVKSINWPSFNTQSYNPFPTESEQLSDSLSQLNDSQDQLPRVPSVLERVKSIKLSSFYGQNYNPFPTESEQAHHSPCQLGRAPSLLDRVKSFKISPFKSDSEHSEPNPHHDPTHHVNRSKSDKSPEKKSTGKIKKSCSERRVAAAADGEKEDVAARPATMKVAATASFGSPEEDGVDSKADDFINRFKQQLKLQRIDSIRRYKEMLNRGT